jgi:hypothetical protein
MTEEIYSNAKPGHITHASVSDQGKQEPRVLELRVMEWQKATEVTEVIEVTEMTEVMEVTEPKQLRMELKVEPRQLKQGFP